MNNNNNNNNNNNINNNKNNNNNNNNNNTGNNNHDNHNLNLIPIKFPIISISDLIKNSLAIKKSKFILLVARNLIAIKLNSKKLYNILILGNYGKPTPQGYFEAFFESSTNTDICYHVRPLSSQSITHFNTKLSINF